jgi:putative ATP-binding cassette transporter
MFLPARAYVPPLPLRAALAYPRPITDFEEAAFIDALTAVGLEHLRPLLDTNDRADRQLNEDEKQNLAFARVLLQRPAWLVVDGAFDRLDPGLRGRIEALLAAEPAGGLVNIGQDSSQEGFFTRKLHLVTDPHGVTFRPQDYCLISSP